MTRLRAVMLDFYGTLVHEDDVSIAAITAQIHHLSPRPVTATEVGLFWYESFSGWCNRSHGEAFVTQRDLGIESLRETLTEFEVNLAPETVIAPQFAHWIAPPLFPDTVTFLDSLKSVGISTLVVSNVDRAEIELAIALHGLEFDGVVTSEDARSYKPRPEMFMLALELLSFDRQAVLHVGDSRSNDVGGAKALGIPVAWLNRSGKSTAGEPVADYVVRDLGELQGIVDLMI